MSRLIILPSVTHTEDVSTFALHNMRRCFFYCHHLADWQTFGNYNTLSDVLLISGSLVTWGGFKRWRTLEDCRLIIGYFTIKCCKSLHDCWNELKQKAQVISEEERLKIWAELELAWIQPTPDRGETKRSKIKILMICEENQEINELQDIYFPFKDTVSNL